MKLLVVSEWFPAPPIAGAKLRAYALVRQLARLADVDLVAQVNTLTPDQVAQGTELLSRHCRSVQSVPAVPYHYSAARALRTLVDPVPATVRHRRNLPLEQILSQRLREGYDAIVATISGSPSAMSASLVGLGARPLILDSLELGVYRPKSGAPAFRRARNIFTWWHLRQYTRQMLKRVEVVAVASQKECDLFAGLLRTPDQCVVVPNVLELDDYQGDFGPRDDCQLLYAGSFGYVANYEAVLWFAREVFGRIAQRETLRLTVTGNTAGRDLAPLKAGCPQIEFAGFVDDVRPYFAKSGICVVPMLMGGSTRLKILEAMAWGTPVVSTTVGAEGLDVVHERNILLADTAAEFAEMIERLLADRALWQRISEAGKALVAEQYSTDRMYNQYAQILSRVA